MATLFAQLSTSQGLPVDSNTSIQSSLVTSIGNYLNCLLVNSGHVQTVVGYQLHTLSRVNSFIQYRQSDYINYLSRLARFFGDNVRQTSTHLIIQKSDLPLLTPKLNNTAESLLVALLLRVMLYESNPLISTVIIEFFKTEFLLTNPPIIQSILLVNLFTLVSKIEIYEIIDNDTIKPSNF